MTVENPCLSGGAIEVFLEPVVPAPRVFVEGDLPISHALLRIGAELGLDMRRRGGRGLRAAARRPRARRRGPRARRAARAAARARGGPALRRPRGQPQARPGRARRAARRRRGRGAARPHRHAGRARHRRAHAGGDRALDPRPDRRGAPPRDAAGRGDDGGRPDLRDDRRRDGGHAARSSTTARRSTSAARAARPQFELQHAVATDPSSAGSCSAPAARKRLGRPKQLLPYRRRHAARPRRRRRPRVRVRPARRRDRRRRRRRARARRPERRRRRRQRRLRRGLLVVDRRGARRRRPALRRARADARRPARRDGGDRRRAARRPRRRAARRLPLRRRPRAPDRVRAQRVRRARRPARRQGRLAAARPGAATTSPRCRSPGRSRSTSTRPEDYEAVLAAHEPARVTGRPAARSALVPTSRRSRSASASVDYLVDEGLATSMFLSLRLPQPLLLEGEAGVGKTEAAKSLAAVLDTPLIRLQCYEGIDAAEALYEWNYPRQLLSIRLAEAGGATLSEEDAVRPGLPDPAPAAARARASRPAAGGAADRRDRPRRRRLRGVPARAARGRQRDDPGARHDRRHAPADHRPDLEPHARPPRRRQAPLPLPLDRLPDRRSARSRSSAAA